MLDHPTGVVQVIGSIHTETLTNYKRLSVTTVSNCLKYFSNKNKTKTKMFLSEGEKKRNIVNMLAQFFCKTRQIFSPTWIKLLGIDVFSQEGKKTKLFPTLSNIPCNEIDLMSTKNRQNRANK